MALGRIEGLPIGVGTAGDPLYSADGVRGWTDEAGAEYREIRSLHGHDAFLLEPARAAEIQGEALRAGVPAGAGAYDP